MSALSATNADRLGDIEEEEERLARVDARREYLRVQTEILNTIADDLQRALQRRAAETLPRDSHG